jgi:hypothetical protein
MEGAAQPVPDNSALPTSYTSEEQAEDRQRALDELSAVAAIYGEAFSTQSAELRAFIATGEGGDVLGDATPLSFDLELQVERDDETTNLHTPLRAGLINLCKLIYFSTRDAA